LRVGLCFCGFSCYVLGGATCGPSYGPSNGWLDGQPAAITRKAGKGRITYFGAWLDDSGMAAAAKWMTDVSGVRPPLGAVPDGVEVNPRYGPKGADYIL